MVALLRRTIILCTMALACAAMIAPATAAEISEQEAYAIGMEAYVYFYPLISMDVTRLQMTNVDPGKQPGSGPMNMFQHVRTYPNAEFKTVVRPNFDTLYSIVWLDLTKEPAIVSAPDTNGRYYLIQMLDMWSDSFAVPGQRTSGTQATNFAVVPPKWSGTLPANVRRIDAPTPYVWCITRIQTNGPKDFEAVNKLQDGFKVTPLSQWGKTPVPPRAANDPNVDMKTKPKGQVENMTVDRYFSYAAELMKTNPPHVTDWSIIARMARIGLVPGQSFDLSKQTPLVRNALTRAAGDGLRLMQTQLPKLVPVTNGWQVSTTAMGVYGNDYLKRAIVAMTGLGANQPADAVYPMAVSDGNGKPLNSANRYVIHFNKGALPPADAFWSITMYDKEGFPVPNPANRFAIGSYDNLKFNPDGSLDIYLQRASPGPDREANWLPSPAQGEIAPTMRLYAPRPAVLNGDWDPPPIKKLQ